MNVKTYRKNYIRFLTEARDLGKNIEIKDYEDIFICGMGGSGVIGMFISSLLSDRKINLVNSDILPKYVSNKSLVVVISYSGNTEEMVSVFNEAIKIGSQVVVITSGGILRDKCIHENLKYIRLPSGIQPRDAFPYMLMPVLNILGVKYDVQKLIANINNARIDGKAKELASNLKGKIPIVYSSDRTYPVAYRWKTQFNENAKIHAFSNKISELNHNELEGYENINGDYYVIMIRDGGDPVKHIKRFDLTKDLIMERKIQVIEISITGKHMLNRMIVESFIGDMTSLYLAEQEEIESEPVKLIEDFKKNLKK